MGIDLRVLEGVRKATRHAGWTAERVVLLDGGPAIQLTDGPAGRGQKRATWLIVGGENTTLPDCFRVLADCLELIGGRL